MADLSIRKEFVDGMYDIFSTLFNDGESDGIKLYLMSDRTRTNIYKESKNKIYKKPILLVAQVRMETTRGKQDVESIKHIPTFVVPLKSLQDNGISVERKNLETMRAGIVEFHNVFYSIEAILPKVYVEDVFLFYHFVCIEEIGVKDILIEGDY